MAIESDEPLHPESGKPKGAILIVSTVGVLTLVLWGALFALSFIRG